MTPPTGLDDCPAKTEAPALSYHRHCEPQSGVAISWYDVQICTDAQEIPTACGLGMTAGDGAGAMGWKMPPDAPGARLLGGFARNYAMSVLDCNTAMPILNIGTASGTFFHFFYNEACIGGRIVERDGKFILKVTA